MTTVALRPSAVPDASPSYPRDPRARLGELLDPHSVSALHPADASGVTAVRGRIDGRTVVAYCADAAQAGGATGAAGRGHIVRAVDAAVSQRSPVIGLWHSGGAGPVEGAGPTSGVDAVLAAMTRASGRVPRLSVVLGPSTGAAAYGTARSDLVITSPAARQVGTGPAHLTAGSETDAHALVRQVVGLLARRFLAGPGVDAAAGPDPAGAGRVYDVRPLVRALLDPGLVELQPAGAAGVVTGLGRLAGRTIGVLADHAPAGPVDAAATARFVRMCDTLGVPLLVLADVPGYLPGGVGATEPRVTVVTREVIDPAATRRRLATVFAAASAGRGLYGNIPL